MNRTAYLIAKIDMKGVIVDAQVASEFPVTQKNDGTHQVKVAEAYGVNYDQALTSLYRKMVESYPWALNHRTLRMQVEKDLDLLGRRGLEKT